MNVLMMRFIKQHFQKSYTTTSKEVPTDSMFRALCEENKCGKYGTSWACPPGAGTMEEILARCHQFSNATLVSKTYTIADPFDYDGMYQAKRAFNRLLRLMRKDLMRFDSSHLIFGVGACDVSNTCMYPNAPCAHPDMMLVSMEAACIDVGRFAAMGKMEYLGPPNTIKYFGCIFHN